MRRSQMPRHQLPATKSPHLALLEQLAALAGERSRLLAEEAKLWSDARRAITEFAGSGAASAVEQRAASASADGDRRRLLDVKEAAKFLRLSDKTLNKWRLKGGGPEFIRLGGRVLYQFDVLESFLQHRSFPHTSAYRRDR
jgi:hypothetical protein